MSIVIDIQGMKDKLNAFIPKEVAVVSVHDSYLDHWIIKPPYNYNELSYSSKRENAWLQRNYHGVGWSEGSTSLHDMNSILKKIVLDADRVFTRGSAKSMYLGHLTGCFIINLEEDLEDPSFRNLPTPGTYCMYHGLLRKKNIGVYKCSLDNAAKIKTWLSHSDRIDSLWEYKTTKEWPSTITRDSEEERHFQL